LQGDPTKPITVQFLRRTIREAFFLAEIERAARFGAMIAWRKLRRLACLILWLLAFFEAAFLAFLAAVLPFPMNFLPSRSAVRTKLLCDNASGNALALAAIVPNVLPIDSATLARIVSSWMCLCLCLCDAICQLLFVIHVINVLD
jgi:hypothetical protein